jgi:hypothetical protein
MKVRLWIHQILGVQKSAKMDIDLPFLPTKGMQIRIPLIRSPSGGLGVVNFEVDVVRYNLGGVIDVTLLHDVRAGVTTEANIAEMNIRDTNNENIRRLPLWEFTR